MKKFQWNYPGEMFQWCHGEMFQWEHSRTTMSLIFEPVKCTSEWCTGQMVTFITTPKVPFRLRNFAFLNRNFPNFLCRILSSLEFPTTVGVQKYFSKPFFTGTWSPGGKILHDLSPFPFVLRRASPCFTGKRSLVNLSVPHFVVLSCTCHFSRRCCFRCCCCCCPTLAPIDSPLSHRCILCYCWGFCGFGSSFQKVFAFSGDWFDHGYFIAEGYPLSGGHGCCRPWDRGLWSMDHWNERYWE